jgi:splicing factor 4
MDKKRPAVNDLFGEDSDEEHLPTDGGSQGCASKRPTTAPHIDSKVAEVADKLADFVSKNGRHYEDLTRERNPGNTPFKFLWNKASNEYKYYEAKLNSLSTALPSQQGGIATTSRPKHEDYSRSRYGSDGSRRPLDTERDRYNEGSRRSNYHNRDDRNSKNERGSRDDWGGRRQDDHGGHNSRQNADKDYRRGRLSEDSSRNQLDRYSSKPQDDPRPGYASAHSGSSVQTDEPASKRGRWDSNSGTLLVGSSQPAAAGVLSAGPAAATGTATLSAMDEYMKRLEEQAQKKREDDEEEERRRRASQPLLKETAFDRRKVVAVFKDDGQRGHHMDDFIPKEELAKFMAKCGDKQLQEQEEAETAIGADNIGHKLLQKMGWKQGQGIGAKSDGITVPVAAVKQDNLGLGAQAHGAVEETDDPFEQYRKRMMLGYKYRPNPLGNPRKAYY